MSWPRRNSVMARWALLAYVAVIVYASLHPFQSWRNPGIDPWEFVLAPWPRYWTGFDLVTNWLAYVPLGTLIVWAFYPRYRSSMAVTLALFAGAFLSATLEGLQTYLPNRISSNVDLGLNAFGTLCGAAFGHWTARSFIDKGRLREWRLRWFDPQASAGLVLVLAWFAAQLHPQALAFGTGEVLAPLLDALEPWLDVNWWPGAAVLSPEQHLIAETIASTTAFTGAAMLFVWLMRPLAPHLRLLLVFAAAAWLVKSVGAATLIEPGLAWSWATPAASFGFALGLAFTAAASFTPHQVQRVLAIMGIGGGLVVVNLMPDNPYYLASLAQWRQGAWINFNGLLNVLAMAWPFIALAYLFLAARRVK
ncbi:MAG: VanZ family protein [Burkholderiales bacterium]|nr:VanZ family protein [Burkholderiales bacterium]MCA3162027.1 VanZ family protein [Burkholderiales bacterium]MCA3164540.1 VanZ family protein [Burkholderiales bacterium]MCA3164949.1 VanZ family protein [Burkholderiales bacterium]MCA3169412.1 VanZ family protein [Burkholderiales bacterium]